MVAFVVSYARVSEIIFNISRQKSLENSGSKFWVMNKDDRFSNLMCDHIDNDTVKLGIENKNVFIFTYILGGSIKNQRQELVQYASH